MGTSTSHDARSTSRQLEALALVGLGLGVALGAGSLLLLLAAVGLLFAWMVIRTENRGFAALTLGLLLVAPWQHLTILSQRTVAYPVLWIVLLLVVTLVLRDAFPQLDRRALFGFALVFGWAVLGMVLGHGNLSRLTSWVVFWGLGFGCFTLLSVPGALRRLVQNSWWVGAVLGGYAIVEWLLKRNLLFGDVIKGLWDPSFYADNTFRITASLGHPIVAAAVFGFLLTLLAWAWANEVLTPRRFAAGFIPCGVALVLSGSRGALVVTMAAILLVIVVPGRSPRRRVALLLSLALAAVVVVTLVPTTLEARFAKLSSDASFLQRVAGLEAAREVVAREPLWGMGAGYGDLALRDLGYIETNYESEYAGLLIGLGIPGALLVLGLPLIALFRTRDRRLRIALSVAPLAVYAVGILGPANMFEWWGGTILYWTAIAFVVMGDTLIEATPEAS